MRVGIIIITYNIDINVFLLQIEAIRKYCRDHYTIEVVDNSSIKESSSGIAHQCGVHSIPYHKCYSSHGPGTESHAFAANFSYSRLFKHNYDYFLYIDHDCIPIQNFSVTAILKDKIIGGLGQGTTTPYFWAGMVFWNNNTIDKELIDFSPSHDLKIDTGGMLYKAIERYGKENCVFFSEEYYQNVDIKCDMYNFYSILGGIFMHFINASNWNKKENNQERINSLINICKQWMAKN